MSAIHSINILFIAHVNLSCWSQNGCALKGVVPKGSLLSATTPSSALSVGVPLILAQSHGLQYDTFLNALN